MSMEKDAKKFSNWFAKEMKKSFNEDEKEMYKKFYTKYLELLNSLDCKEYSKHHLPINKTYFFICGSLLMIELGYSFEDTEKAFYNISGPIRKKFRKIVNFIDKLPFGYRLFVFLVKKMNNDYGDDIHYDFIKEDKDKYEHQLSRCIYIDIFEHYGIRKYCKLMCDSDVQIMGGVSKHSKYIRYSDMSDSDVCHDAILRVKKK